MKGNKKDAEIGLVRWLSGSLVPSLVPGAHVKIEYQLQKVIL